MAAPIHFPLGAEVRLDALDLDPYPVLAGLREREPVSWVPETSMWFVTRRADCVEVLRDAVRFTTVSERSTIRDIFGDHMMTTDGERALRYKRSCLHAFRSGAIEKDLGPWVSAEAARLVASLPMEGPFELTERVGSPLAIGSVLRVLGLPSELSRHVRGWYAHFAAALANFTGDPEIRSRGKAAARAFDTAVRPLLRGSDGGSSGLLAHLASREEDPLTHDEIIANALIILFGGIETTESMIANTVWSVLAAGAWPEIKDDADLRPDAIEEAIRWQPAVQSCTRHTTETVAVADVEIPKGSIVQCMIGAANRDPRHFPMPDEFDLRRANASDHLSFGIGRHLCLGAHLARAEIRAVLDALAERFSKLTFSDDAPPPLRGYEFRRPPSLRLVGAGEP